MDVPERRNPTLPTLRYKAVEPAMRELFVEAAEDATSTSSGTKPPALSVQPTHVGLPFRPYAAG